MVVFGSVAAFGFAIAWVATAAQQRGRIALGWATFAAVLAVIVFWTCAWLPGLRDDHESDTLSLLVAVAPAVLAFGSMAGVVWLLRRMPIKTSSRRQWQVDEISAGASGNRGHLRLEPAGLRVELTGNTQVIPLGALRTVAADGECLRLAWDREGVRRELLVLPRGTPDTPAGRRAQSQHIEALLRGTLPTATAHAPR